MNYLITALIIYLAGILILMALDKLNPRSVVHQPFTHYEPESSFGEAVKWPLYLAGIVVVFSILLCTTILRRFA